MQLTFASVFAFAYLGLVASFAASSLYPILLRRYTVTGMAYLQFATATVAAVIGVILGGEHLGSSLAPGVIAVLGGLFLLSKSSAGEMLALRRRSNPLEAAFRLNRSDRINEHRDRRQTEPETSE